MLLDLQRGYDQADGDEVGEFDADSDRGLHFVSWRARHRLNRSHEVGRRGRKRDLREMQADGRAAYGLPHLRRCEFRGLLADEPDERRVLGREEVLNGRANATVDELTLPQRLKFALAHALLVQQFQRLAAVLRLLGIGHADDAKELLVNIDGGMGVVEAILIAVGHEAPTDAHERSVGQHLRGAATMTEGGAEGLGFDEEKRSPEDQERVVDGVVLGLAPVLSAHVVEITQVPTESRQDGLDEDCLGVLLTDAFAAFGALAQVADLLPHLGERLAKSRASRNGHHAPHVVAATGSAYTRQHEFGHGEYGRRGHRRVRRSVRRALLRCHPTPVVTLGGAPVRPLASPVVHDAAAGS